MGSTTTTPPLESGQSDDRQRSDSSDASPEDIQLGLDLLELLRSGLYQDARESVIYFEVVERERLTDQIIEIRDALDHMAQAAKQPQRDLQLASLAQSRDHLRRAGVESAQFALENRLALIEQRMKNYNLKRFFLTELPSKGEVQRKLSLLQRELSNGRTGKAASANGGNSLAVLQAAYIEAANLSDELGTGSIQLWTRVFFYFALPVAGLALGIAALF